MALEDMKSRFSPQPTIIFKRDKTGFDSTIQPLPTNPGQKNLTSNITPLGSNPGQNNLISSVNPLYIGSGLAKGSLLIKK